MQLREMESLKSQLEQFFLSIREFRNFFRGNAPFTFTGSPMEAYAIMDTHAKQLVMKEKEARRFNELEELFELQISKYPETGDTVSLLLSYYLHHLLLIMTTPVRFFFFVILIM